MTKSCFKKTFGIFTVTLLLVFLFNGCGSDKKIVTETDNAIALENDNLKVSLSKNSPVILEYLYKPNNAVLLGDITETAPKIAVLKGVNNIEEKTSYAVNIKDGKVIYHATVSYENAPAVEFDLIYALVGKDLTIEFNNVVEHENFYLLDIQLPKLVSVKAEGSDAKLAIPTDSGRLVDIANSEPNEHEMDINWLNANLCGFVYNSKAIGVLDTDTIENHFIASVSKKDGIKYGSLSAKIIHRMNEYDLEEFKSHPKLRALDTKYILKIQDSCKTIITIDGDYDKDGQVSWVDGTKIYRDRIKAKPNPYYADREITEFYIAYPNPNRPRITPFPQVLERIKEFANQTDSPKRIFYLAGWQYNGHDTGYPSVDKVNEKLGGYDALKNLVEEARKYNVTVSFHDNYDDSYPDNPGWDPNVICQDAQGNLIKGGVWEGVQSYLISNYKYAEKSGVARARDTIKRYSFIKESYFIDVLAGGYNNGRKYDFNPESPAGAYKNFEGKLMIVREFNKADIDVTSEDFTGFFVGHVGYFTKIIDTNGKYFTSEEQIPLIPFIYHGKTSYGCIQFSKEILKRFLYGDGAGSGYYSGGNASEYVLSALPKKKFYGKAMESFRKDGDIKKVTYEDGSYIEINENAGTYTVFSDGRIIAKDFTSFVPTKENTFLSCSRNGGKISYPAPKKWTSSNKIQVQKMNADGSRNKVDFKLTNRNLEFDTETNAIYKVIYQ